MTMANIQTCYIPKQKRISELRPGTFKYNSSKSLKLLQRLCLWILDKIGCHYYEDYMMVETVKINPDDIVDLVMRQAGAIRYVLGDCSHLILGREQMHQLHLGCAERQLEFMIPWHYGEKEFAGMTVVFVPWFDGIVCLSSLDIVELTR